MELSFRGAAGGVTGSCHLLPANGKQILVDCGMFQGSRDLDEENTDHFGFDPREIDILLLTHVHLNHCGRIPLLVRHIIDGQNPVHIFGEEVCVAAKVYTIGGFSAHADQQEPLDWRHGSGTPAITFLVHGEETGRAARAEVLRGQGLRVEVPAMHDRYRIGASH